MAYRTKQEELAIITQTYDLILWSSNHTGTFPWSYLFRGNILYTVYRHQLAVNTSLSHQFYIPAVNPQEDFE